MFFPCVFLMGWTFLKEYIYRYDFQTFMRITGGSIEGTSDSTISLKYWNIFMFGMDWIKLERVNVACCLQRDPCPVCGVVPDNDHSELRLQLRPLVRSEHHPHHALVPAMRVGHSLRWCSDINVNCTWSSVHTFVSFPADPRRPLHSILVTLAFFSTSNSPEKVNWVPVLPMCPWRLTWRLCEHHEASEGLLRLLRAELDDGVPGLGLLPGDLDVSVPLLGGEAVTGGGHTGGGAVRVTMTHSDHR